MRWLLVLLLIGTGCSAGAYTGQASSPQTQSAVTPTGPHKLEIVSSGTLPAIYTLRLLDIADSKPISRNWLLQKQASNNASDPSEASQIIVTSLSSPALRAYLTRLPPGTIIIEPGIQSSNLSDARETSGAFTKNLQAFSRLCRSKRIRFEQGILF
jgi:hypothetical protein